MDCIYNNSFSQSINYETEIQPIFDNSCMPCHSGNSPSAGLDLTSYENIMSGSNDGAVITIGDYENSVGICEESSFPDDGPRPILWRLFRIK